MYAGFKSFISYNSHPIIRWRECCYKSSFGIDLPELQIIVLLIDSCGDLLVCKIQVSSNLQKSKKITLLTSSENGFISSNSSPMVNDIIITLWAIL